MEKKSHWDNKVQTKYIIYILYPPRRQLSHDLPGFFFVPFVGVSQTWSDASIQLPENKNNDVISIAQPKRRKNEKPQKRHIRVIVVSIEPEE